MKKLLKFASVLLFVAVLASCTAYKSVPYLQNVDQVELEKKPLYDAKIMPKDLLTITVNTTDPEAAAPFNHAASNVARISCGRIKGRAPSPMARNS